MDAGWMPLGASPIQVVPDWGVAGFREELFSETGLPVFRVLGNLALSCVVLRVRRRRLATQDFLHRRAGLPNRGLLGNSRGVRRRLPFSEKTGSYGLWVHRSGGTRKLRAWQTRSCSKNSCGGWRP